MKRNIILLLVLSIFIPTTVLAEHLENTPVIIDVFIGEDTYTSETFLSAIEDLQQDPEVKGKFKLVKHTFDDRVGKVAYNYAGLFGDDNFAYYIGRDFSSFFWNTKYDYTDGISKYYIEEREDLKKTILELYGTRYQSIMEEIEKGTYDFLINKEPIENNNKPTTTTPSIITDSDLKELESIFKEYEKKFSKVLPYIYAFGILIFLKICAIILKKSIQKNH